MRAASDASRTTSKWASRASLDPFAGASTDPLDVQNGAETAALSPDQADDGKENRIPSSGRNWGHPNVSMSRGHRQSLLEAQLLPPELNFEASAPLSLLGKRPNPDKRSPAAHRASQSDDESDSDTERAARNPWVASNAVAHFEQRALELHGSSLELEHTEDVGSGSATMLVDDFSHLGQLRFGAVPLGERRGRQLTLENASELGNARIKYEGYTLVRDGSGVENAAATKSRFKCDLHVCVVDAMKSVTLRVTFEPQQGDVGREVTAMLRFTVNDRFKLQCRATGSVTPRVPKVARFGRSRPSRSVDTVVVVSREKQTRPPRTPAVNTRQMTSEPRSTAFTISSALSAGHHEPEQEPVVVRPRAQVGDKRPSSMSIEFSPPRNGPKRRRSEPRMGMTRVLTPRKILGAGQDPPSAKKRFSGSWWKQRQEVYDENWMAKQTEGFTKWMNYVLLDGTAQRLSGGDAEDDAEEQGTGAKRRFDFSSLRVLAQKRMESKWAQAAVELYHSPSMDDILFNLQDEIGNQGLLFRADRPVYADVGLQEELIGLLNNYHPVWLCLGLYAVLGNQVMRQEKCSLRTIFSITTAKATRKGKQESPPDRRMPQVLRRIILKHLVKDSHVAQNYRLVKIC